MTSNMFVYFNDAREIISILPIKDKTLELYSVAEFPISVVEGFLTGRLKLHEYRVIKSSSTGKYSIGERKTFDLDLKRRIDSYITEIEEIPQSQKTSKSISVLIENNVDKKILTLNITQQLKDLLDDEDDGNDIGLRNFFKIGSFPLFITKKHDPYFLLTTLTFSPTELLEKSTIEISYDINMADTSIFTTKVLDGFKYTIEGNTHGI